MLRMDQVHVIRHKVLVEGQGIRAVARQMGVSRNTVRKYLHQSEPKRIERQPRRRPVLDQVAPAIERILDEWSDRTTAKQRVTGSRVHQELIERGYTVGVTTVRAYLAEKRRAAAEVFIPLVYTAGDVAQVDFFEVTVDVGGERRKAWKFVMRLMHSGRDFTWIYHRCDQVAFLDGHVRAFAHLGGVPKRLVYDNLTAAVKRRVGCQERELTQRFRALASHYLFEPCFARVGEGHDKGGVESRGKSIRLQHLTPIPQGESLSAISEALMEAIDGRLDRPRERGATATIQQLWEDEAPTLRPLPATPFEARAVVPVRVTRQAMIQVATTRYSVPCHWKCLDATAYVGTEDIRVVCGHETRVLPIEPDRNRVVRYRDYLPELARKPQAVRQVSSQLIQELGAPFDRLWSMASERYSEREAARLLARLIGLMIDEGEATIVEMLHEALERGDLDDLVWRQKAAANAANDVPESLLDIQVESGDASSYDALLQGAGA